MYAKIKSERSSKGQGGNEFLEIDISMEKKGHRHPVIAQLHMTFNEQTNNYYVTFKPIGDLIRLNNLNEEDIYNWVIRK